MSQYGRKQISAYSGTTEAGGGSRRRTLKTSIIPSTSLQRVEVKRNEGKISSRRYSEASGVTQSYSQQIKRTQNRNSRNHKQFLKPKMKFSISPQREPSITYLEKLNEDKNRRITQIYNKKSHSSKPLFNKAKLALLESDSTPVTLQNSPERLSTITEEVEKKRQNLVQKINFKTMEESTMPLPKFCQFVETFSKISNSRSENKTYLFRKLKQTQPDSRQSDQKRKDIDEKRLSQLQFFSQIDHSTLSVIKGIDHVYYGQVNEKGQKNGKGAIFYHSGKRYEGTFFADQKNGIGYEVYPDGSSYEGSFEHGKKNGKGRFQWSNGQVYEGQWKDNLKHGSGLWEGQNSASYLGEWKFGAISGFGILTNEKGERYEGEFLNFNKEGQGTYKLENGERLIGNFHRNQPNGECEYWWKNGEYYKGGFCNGLRHGRGILKYADGSCFEGEFRNDKKCGLGEERYLDGVVYLGNYENDLRHGYGKLTYNDQVYYEGYWLNNQAVIFQAEGDEIIPEDDQDRVVSGFENKLSKQKLDKLQENEKENILKALKSKGGLEKSKIQKFSRKNLFQRLCNPRRRVCRCALKHH